MVPVAFFLTSELSILSSSSAANGPNRTEPRWAVEETAPSPPPERCTESQLSVIRQQLPPDDCAAFANNPWSQRCSLTYATRCPDNVWLQRHYAKIHGGGDRPSTTGLKSTRPEEPPPPFLGIIVGCNKGMDAVDAMRMGSGNPLFDKSVWRDAMTRGGNIEMSADVCNQVSTAQFALPNNGNVTSASSGPTADHGGGGDRSNSSSSAATPFSSHQLHCIEPMPTTAYLLKRSAWETKYDRMGFVVAHAAVSRENGIAKFSRARKPGVENKGIGGGCGGGSCMNVTVYSLDTYVEKFVPGGNVPINYLSVDVEGFDYEVLLGGMRGALNRTHYLEFEYNWMLPWKDQSFEEVIERLDREFGFTCYWAGFNDTIWRITNCWLDHYEMHFWSNVACVNRNAVEVRDVAEDMEDTFLETMTRTDAVRDYEHRFKRETG